MIIIGTITFSEECANETAKCYMNLPPVPDFIKITGTYVYNKPGEDLRAFAIFEFDEARADEANDYFKARHKVFSQVKCLKAKAEEWLNVQDALEMIEGGEYNLNALSTGNF